MHFDFVQPPKKKGKGKKGAKARSPTLVNGLTIDESTKDQVQRRKCDGGLCNANMTSPLRLWGGAGVSG